MALNPSASKRRLKSSTASSGGRSKATSSPVPAMAAKSSTSTATSSVIYPPFLLKSLRDSIERRLRRALELENNPRAQEVELELCRRDNLYWFDNWAWTYNPKTAGSGVPAYLPFDLFPRQRELVHFLDERLALVEDGAIPKSRDIGFTWVAGGYALHKWRFIPGFKTTFGSRKGELVDRIGDPDCIFEKIRMLLRSLPRWMWPVGFNPLRHDNSMLLINPDNENTIRGEGGDEMGRGGRSTMYVLDEFAFVERAARVEAATSGNTDVRIYASSANGPGGEFHGKLAGERALEQRQIFYYHYRDDPRKTPEWATKKKKTMEEWMWASEYEIDFTASVEGICIPGKWVEASTRLLEVLAKHKIKFEPSVEGIVGNDVGAGKAKSVAIARFGGIIAMPESWGDPDTTETAFRALDYCEKTKLVRSDGTECRVKKMRFDEVGVGKGVLSTLTHHKREGITTTPINSGSKPSETLWPDGKNSQEKFFNLKAEVWFLARQLYKNTYEMVRFLEGLEGGERHEISDLISTPRAATTFITQLSSVKWFRRENGLIIIESKEQLKQRNIASPDQADAFMLTLVPDSDLEDWIGAFGRG